MKKLAVLFSALILCVMMSVSAGARTKTIADYQLCYDTCYDFYWIMDPDTSAAVGIRYTDGAIDWFDGYPEEVEDEQDNTSTGNQSYDEYLDWVSWYTEPFIEDTSTYDKVNLLCYMPSEWEADLCILTRKASNESKWTEVTSYDVWDAPIHNVNNYHELEYSASTPNADYITYCFTFYKNFDVGRKEITSAEITVEGKGDTSGYEDLEPPTITSSKAVMNDVRLTCTLPLEWDVEDYDVERRTDNSDWVKVSSGYARSYGNEYKVSYNDTNTPEGKVYYRFKFYRYTLGSGSSGWVQTLATTAGIELDIKPDYPAPKITSEAGNSTVTLKISADKRWNLVRIIISRQEVGTRSLWTIGTLNKSHSTETSTETLYTFTDKDLSPNKSYYYRLELFDSSSKQLDTLETTVTTTATPEKPKMLTPVAHSNSITLTAEVDSLWNADGFEVLRYSSKKKKWEKLTDSQTFGFSDRTDGVFRTASYTNTDLKPSVTYKYKIKLYREVNGKREYFSTLSKSVKTLMAAPKLTLGVTAKKATLKWNKVSGADGYEVYVLPIDKGNYDTMWTSDPNDRTTLPQYDASLAKYNQSYNSWSTSSKTISKFTKKSTIKNGKTTVSYTIKSSKVYVYIVRAYKVSGGKKIYSDFSNQESTDTTSALLNGVKLKSEVTVNASDLKLIKAALKKCTNSKMTNAEKAAAIYVYVHNAATYEYDYTKIPSDPIEAILSAGRGQCYQYAATYQAMMKYIGYDVKLVSGKTASGSPHWWCQLTIAGTDYMIDPQVGGRFLITYESMWDYAVTPEKVYD